MVQRSPYVGQIRLVSRSLDRFFEVHLEFELLASNYFLEGVRVLMRLIVEVSVIFM